MKCSQRPPPVPMPVLIALMAVPVAAAAPTPTASERAEMLAGGLGGSIEDIVDVWGMPDDEATEVDGVGEYIYESIDVGGVEVDTLAFVYGDEDRVTAVRVAWDEKPTSFADREALAEIAADVMPEDGDCADKPVSNRIGKEVYLCTSEALESVFTAAEMEKLLRKGEPGDFNWAVITPTETRKPGINLSLGKNAMQKPKEQEKPVDSPVDLHGRIGGARFEFEPLGRANVRHARREDLGYCGVQLSADATWFGARGEVLWRWTKRDAGHRAVHRQTGT